MQTKEQLVEMKSEHDQWQNKLKFYRDEIKQCVRDSVVHRYSKPAAIHALREWSARNVTAGDRARFIEMVEEQLLGLRETNIARMRLRPSEFAAWLPAWQGQGGRSGGCGRRFRQA